MSAYNIVNHLFYLLYLVDFLTYLFPIDQYNIIMSNCFIILNNVRCPCMDKLIILDHNIVSIYIGTLSVQYVILKYIELSNNIQELENIFDSPRYEEFLKPAKINTLVIKNISECWLKTHTISEKELELLKLTIKQL